MDIKSIIIKKLRRMALSVNHSKWEIGEAEIEKVADEVIDLIKSDKS